jgi:hypothetical protein
MRLVRCCKDPHAHSTSYVIDLCVIRHDECLLMYVWKVGIGLSRMCDISLSPRYPRCHGRYRPTLRTAVCYVFVLSFARPTQRLCTPRLHLALIPKVESFFFWITSQGYWLSQSDEASTLVMVVRRVSTSKSVGWTFSCCRHWLCTMRKPYGSAYVTEYRHDCLL